MLHLLNLRSSKLRYEISVIMKKKKKHFLKSQAEVILLSVCFYNASNKQTIWHWTHFIQSCCQLHYLMWNRRRDNWIRPVWPSKFTSVINKRGNWSEPFHGLWRKQAIGAKGKLVEANTYRNELELRLMELRIESFAMQIRRKSFVFIKNWLWTRYELCCVDNNKRKWIENFGRSCQRIVYLTTYHKPN